MPTSVRTRTRPGATIARRRKPTRLDRRSFVASLVAIAIALAQAAPSRANESSTKLHRIGFLGNSTAALEANLVGPFRDGLRELGYVEGRDIAIEYRWAEGDYERFPRLVAELLAVPVEIIVTAGTPSAQAVQRASRTIPLVMVAVGDPVGTHLVASLAHPGGNATGLTSIAPDLEGKRLELLTQVAPSLSRIAVLWNPDNAFHVGAEREASRVLHLDMVSVPVRTANDFDAAFDTIVSSGAGAMSVLADRVFLHNRTRIVAFAAKRRLPAVYVSRARGCWRPDVVRSRLRRHASARRELRRPDFEGCEARRPADRATETVQPDRQREDGTNARHPSAKRTAASRERSARVAPA